MMHLRWGVLSFRVISVRYEKATRDWTFRTSPRSSEASTTDKTFGEGLAIQVSCGGVK